MNLKIAGFLLVGATAFAQPRFDVASVKPNQSGERMDYGLQADGMFGRNMPAIGWIQIAYQVKEFQIVGPAWISAEKFDIEAKTESAPHSSSRIYAMLQSLLAERFNLKLHRETRESTVYALVLARSGLKMKLSKDQSLWAGDFPDGSPDGRPVTGGSPTELAPGRFLGQAIPMTMFVNLLAGPLGRPVINKTGLTGRYDIDLRYDPVSGQSPDTADTPSLFSVIQEQLGLRLESEKGPVEFLVIDHIERPSVN
jgi:uncharacterized protein (TIGR03435 family)